ncbi:hypothetical protein IANJMKHF_00294 [Klebsiella phage CPRSA]|nr:hypothetical protein IANJMKHF_00294 [Klebsiella phage CPRSA]
MKMIMETVFGSHLYGLETPTSDKDYKGIISSSSRNPVRHCEEVY